MKTPFTVFFICAGIVIVLAGFISRPVFSQGYHKLIRTNTFWDDYIHSDEPIFNNCYSSASKIYFTGADTMIYGYTYQILKEYPYEGDSAVPGVFCQPLQIDTVSNYTYYFLREDTLTRRVYIFDPDSYPSDQLLYDFTLNVGDTLKSDYSSKWLYLIVTSIDSVTLNNGEKRKRFIFDNDPLYQTSYVESLGGIAGLFTPLFYAFFYPMVYGTFCITENGDHIWGYENGCDYYFVGVEQHQAEMSLAISPNPAVTNFTVSLNRTDMHNVMLYCWSSTGKMILSRPLDQQRTTIHIDGIVPGVYVARVICDEGTWSSKLVVR